MGGQVRTSDESLFINERTLISPFMPGKRMDEKRWCEIFPDMPKHLKDIALSEGSKGGYEQRVRDLNHSNS